VTRAALISTLCCCLLGAAMWVGLILITKEVLS
jgi:hypothetical protein